MADNEEALCEAVICLLEQELGAQRSDVTYPETDHSGPPVEMRLRIGERRFAIEHTLIEPFALAIQTGKEFQALAGEIESVLNGAMPRPGVYELVFPVHPTHGRARRTHAALRERIMTWVREAGDELHGECPERLDCSRRPFPWRGVRTTEIDGVPLSLSLSVHWAQSGRHDCALFLARLVGDDVEGQRRIRIRTALDKKLPKLEACRVEGDESLLILEYADIALTNQVLVAQALEAELTDRADGPDHIFIADTTGDEMWHLFRPVIDKKFMAALDYIEIVPGAAATSAGRRLVRDSGVL